MRFFTISVLFALVPFIIAQNNPVGISQIFNWLGSQPKPEEIENLATKNEFDNPLPSDGMNKLISDTLTHRLKDEGEDTIQSRSTLLSRNSRRYFARSVTESNSNHIPLLEALRIVNTSNLTDCVARVICELSCNSNAFGNQGRTVFRSLIKIQLDKTVKSEDAKIFRQAASKGRHLVQTKKDCNECYYVYPSCKSSSKDLIAVSAMFKF